jgi:hypothetical protein
MVTVRVKKPFLRGETIMQPGEVLEVPGHMLPKLHDLIEVLTHYEAALMERSSDWQQFCDNHERTLPGGMCLLKRQRCADPFNTCEGWQLKKKRLH